MTIPKNQNGRRKTLKILIGGWITTVVAAAAATLSVLTGILGTAPTTTTRPAATTVTLAYALRVAAVYAYSVL